MLLLNKNYLKRAPLADRNRTGKRYKSPTDEQYEKTNGDLNQIYKPRKDDGADGDRLEPLEIDELSFHSSEEGEEIFKLDKSIRNDEDHLQKCFRATEAILIGPTRTEEERSKLN